MATIVETEDVATVLCWQWDAAADFACADIACIRSISQSSVGACQSPGSNVQVTT